jgi:ABC-2 type transport system permease protein
MLLVQAGIELRLALRHPEQMLLTLCVPVLLLVGLTLIPVIALPAPRVVSVLPSILALAVVSTAFTSQAISLGFDRRYGAIHRLAVTAVPRWLLCAGRMAASLGVLIVQLAVLIAVGFGLGWRPPLASVAVVLLVLPLGWAAFGAWGVFLGGWLRAEVTLAVANLVWFGLLIAGGIGVPLAGLPRPVAEVDVWLPSGALAEALRAVILTDHPPPAVFVLVLVSWALLGAAAAVRTFRLR